MTTATTKQSTAYQGGTDKSRHETQGPAHIAAHQEAEDHERNSGRFPVGVAPPGRCGAVIPLAGAPPRWCWRTWLQRAGSRNWAGSWERSVIMVIFLWEVEIPLASMTI